MKSICSVFIYKDSERYVGLITGLLTNPIRWIEFDPLCILSDICTGKDDTILNIRNTSDTVRLKQVLSCRGDSRIQFNSVISGISLLLSNSINSGNSVPSELIDFLRSFFDISFRLHPIADTSDSLTPSTFISYSDYKLEDVLDLGTSLYHSYLYECFSPADVLFSILHFLAIKNYKFKACDHCGRVFATDNLKNLYCPRFSQYRGHENMSCSESVKRIRQDIKRQHTQISNNLRANYYNDRLNDFEMEFGPLYDSMKKKTDYNAIDACYNVLDKSRWYKKR